MNYTGLVIIISDLENPLLTWMGYGVRPKNVAICKVVDYSSLVNRA